MPLPFMSAARGVRPASATESYDDANRPDTRRPRVRTDTRYSRPTTLRLSEQDRARAAVEIQKRLYRINQFDFAAYVICLSAPADDHTEPVPIRPYTLHTAAVGYIYNTLGAFSARGQGRCGSYPIADLLSRATLDRYAAALVRAFTGDTL